MLHTTNYLVSLLWIAGVVQASDVLANVAIPAKIDSRENLARVSPIVRQIFWSHWFFIALVLLFFSALCFLFAPFLAGGTPPGRFVSGVLAVFWFSRTLAQFFGSTGNFGAATASPILHSLFLQRFLQLFLPLHRCG
jgi:hypothetical protein